MERKPNYSENKNKVTTYREENGDTDTPKKGHGNEVFE
jgi:hypothetical protein